MHRMRRQTLCAALVVFLGGSSLLAQDPVAPAQPQPPTGLATAAVRADEPATVVFFNRPIVVLRARVVGRSPGDRALGARHLLDDLVAQQRTRPVESRPFEEGTVISVDGQGVIVLTPADIDELSGETMPAVAAQTVMRLQQALSEVEEAHRPGLLLRAGASALGVVALSFLLLWGERRLRRRASAKLDAIAERTVMQSGIGDVEGLRSSRLLEFQRGLVLLAGMAINLVVVYTALSFILRRFPYTRPWGESMRGFLLATVTNLALGMLRAVPGLFTAALIFLITLFAVRVLGFWFQGIQAGRIKVRWLYPDTAPPTRRLLTTLLWLFAIVVAYPYLPGSQTDAFKGVSVFLGLVVTFGSSGLVNQIMSGFMVTYSRAVRVGDYVKVGDVQGTVQHLGVLSTKVLTLWNEEVTIPNAVMVSQVTTDYSRPAETAGVFTPTSVTIGYDAPWRQVQALLLRAAERTSGIRRDPKPMVLQASLEDFYVKYTLFVCLENQQSRPFTLHTLHSNIQDLFNEYGVQIMSPNYAFDPTAPKIVPKKDWFAEPASPDAKLGLKSEVP
jgi:small-conductance mechanosensitive channel